MVNLSPFIEFLQPFWPYFVAGVGFSLMVGTALHVIFNKHDIRSATGWLGLVWFAPVLGAMLYFLFGINRIQRLAKSKFAAKKIVPLPKLETEVTIDFIRKKFGAYNRGLPMLAELTGKVSRQPLVAGNCIKPLLNGDQAFPAMLAAIERAEYTVTLCSYIFDNDVLGNKFRKALADAVKRGVQVRALIDAIGVRYSFPSIIRGLRKDGVWVARFLKSRLAWPFRYMNLRNHRKILVVDGKIGFTGGINLRDGSVLADNPSNPVQDTHFCLQGPIVTELQQSFAEDWIFTTGERLKGEQWFPDLSSCGEGIARGISDGPDDDFGKLRLVILGALTSAHKSVRIVTPYFLPDNELVAGLKIAALRGIKVQILLPGVTNLGLVKWASDAGLEELLRAGCRVFYTAPPFDHSKLMTVDGSWVLLGSANWDPRSLTLNFEFNVECYDENLAGRIDGIINGKIADAHEVTIEEMRSCFVGIHLRNRLLRLFSPYL
ncbi:MAG: cardiolipin synthase [Thermodesulfobacteriota bacterium]